MHELRTVLVCGIDQLFPEDRRHVAYVSVAIYSCMIPLNHSGLVLYNFVLVHSIQIYTIIHRSILI